jgi:hypothetical protein
MFMHSHAPPQCAYHEKHPKSATRKTICHQHEANTKASIMPSRSTSHKRRRMKRPKNIKGNDLAGQVVTQSQVETSPPAANNDASVAAAPPQQSTDDPSSSSPSANNPFYRPVGHNKQSGAYFGMDHSPPKRLRIQSPEKQRHNNNNHHRPHPSGIIALSSSKRWRKTKASIMVETKFNVGMTW